MVFLYETFRHLFWKKGPLYGLTVAADSELMSLLLSVDCSCQAVYWIFFLLFFSHFPFSHNLSLLSEPELRHVCSLPFSPAADVTAIGKPKFLSPNARLVVVVFSGLLGKCLLCFGTVADPHEAYRAGTFHFLARANCGHIFHLPFFAIFHASCACVSRTHEVYNTLLSPNLYLIKPLSISMTLYPSFAMNNAH